MSNIIPPLLSNTPPPINGPLDDDDDDDEFGHFTSAVDSSYNNEALSIPSSPLHTPPNKLDINSNNDGKIPFSSYFIPIDKDYQDKRKQCDTSLPALNENEVNSVQINVNTEQLENLPNCVPSGDADYLDNDDACVPDDNEHKNTADFGNVPSTENSLVMSDLEIKPAEKPPDLSDATIIENCELHQQKSNEEVEGNQFDDFSYYNNSDEDSSINVAAKVEAVENSSVLRDNQIISESVENVEVAKCSTMNDSDVSLEQEELSEFADFTSFETNNDGFSKFEDFSCKLQPSSSNIATEFQADDDDEFGDFDDYTHNQEGSFANFESTKTTDTLPLSIDKRNVLERAEKIIVDMFPPCQENTQSDSELINFTGNSVFKELKDITETNALTYQWMKSNCQDNLLKALNIDTRNILYGHGWNPSMPKFAANLSFAPLEPVKSDVLTPSPVLTNQESPGNIQAEIPTAQFDWSVSGLTNPLDSLQKDNKDNPHPKDISNPQQKNYDLNSLPVNIFEPLPPRLQSDNESVNSLQFAIDSTQEVEDAKPKQQTIDDEVVQTKNDFGDFASYQQSSKPKDAESTWPTNSTPNDAESIWPTNSTPNDAESTWPATIILKESKINEVENIEPSWLKPTILTPDLPRKTQQVDDDFTDFQTGLPPKKENSKNILEPLKPTILQPQVVNGAALQINWPAPGLSDDEIRNIELNYSSQLKPQTPKAVVKPNNQAVESKHDKKPSKSPPSKVVPQKNDNNDDDDWSDFVCNPEPMKSSFAANFAGLSLTERSGTPELQLSIPQLTHLQPPKAPIPVITPNGLIQTKIPSNVTMNFQPSVPAAPIYPIQQQASNNYFQQPSIISNQYQNHMNGPIFSNRRNGFTSQPQPIKNDDDEDWTDFISSPPVQNNRVAPPRNVEWCTPNIITNPVHFGYNNLVNSKVGKKVTNVSVQPKRTAIPSISALPDLDFIAPKNRTFTKK